LGHVQPLAFLMGRGDGVVESFLALAGVGDLR
jgi:hypothetical protein